MSSNQSTSVSVSIPSLLATLLTVLFVGLKLTGVITWSWLWVLSPIWISIALGGLVLLLILVIALIAVSLKK